MIDLGIVKPCTTVRIPFSSFDKDDGSSITMTNYAAADILIYKDGSTTERASTSGFTATTDFDAKTGKHLAIIDLADNTTAGFFAAGSEYLVAIDAVTVDAVTTGGWIARFKIGVEGAILNTTVATLASQTSMTLTDGPADDNALLGCVVYFHDVATLAQGGFAVVSAYTGSTKTITLTAGASYTVATTDNVSFFPPVNTHWLRAVAQTGRDVGASVLLSTGTGTGQLDFTSGVVKSNETQILGTAISTPATAGILDVNLKNIANAVVSTSTAQLGVNAVQAGATAWGSGAITAASIADGAIDRATFADDTGLKTIRSNTAQAGAATTITLDASASSVTNFYVNDLIVLTGGTGAGQARYCTAYNGSTKVATVTAWATNPDNTTTFAVIGADAIVGATAPTAAQVATAVWTDLLAGSDFSTASSVGKLLKDDVDATVSSRLAPTTAGRTLDVTATGEAGIDWANIGSPTTTVGLSGTTVKTATDVETDTQDIQARLPAALTSNGNMKSSILEWISTLFSEGATGRIATAIQTMFNVASPVLTAQSVNQTGDSYARVGAAGAGLTAIGDARIANLDAAMTTRMASYTQPTGFLAASFPTSGTVAKAGDQMDLVNAPNATAVTAIQSGLATSSALSTAAGNISTILGQTGTTGVIVASTEIAKILTTALTESYSTDGANATLTQLLYELRQFMMEGTIAGTTMTIKKKDGSTTAMTFTLDDATNPTSITRAT